MRFNSKHRLSIASSVLFSLVLASAAQAQWPPSFEDIGKGDPRALPPEAKFVGMSTDMATIAAQKFAFPTSTINYPLIGLTVFPYYQASAPLKQFLNANRVMGMPITDGIVKPNLYSALPPTDLIRLSIPIPQRREPRSTRLALNADLKDEVPWHVASHGGQAFSVPGDNEAMVLASAGTMFNSAGTRILGLRCGTLWVFSGARPVNVLTKYGAARVKPYSIAAVEQTWFNRVRVADLYGSPVDVHLAYKGKDADLAVEKGKEYTFSESSVASSGTSDYIASARPSVATPVLIPELNTVSRNLDPDVSTLVSELKAAKPPFTTIRMSTQYERMMKDMGVTVAMRRNEMRKLVASKDDVTTKPSMYKASLDAKYFVPVFKPVRAVGPVPFPRVEDPLKTKYLAHGYAKYLGSSKFAVDEDGRLSLDSGEGVFEAKSHMRVRAGEVTIDFFPGSIVYINSKKDVVVVRNLKEMYEKNVVLRVGGRSIKCAAGQELVVGNDIPAVATEMKNDGVTRRNVRAIETLNGNVLLNKSEFDITAFMQYSPLMRALFNSKHEGDKQMVADVIKMGAVIQMVTGKRGPYERMSGLPSHGL